MIYSPHSINFWIRKAIFHLLTAAESTKIRSEVFLDTDIIVIAEVGEREILWGMIYQSLMNISYSFSEKHS